MKKARKINWF